MYKVKARKLMKLTVCLVYPDSFLSRFLRLATLLVFIIFDGELLLLEQGPTS